MDFVNIIVQNQRQTLIMLDFVDLHQNIEEKGVLIVVDAKVLFYVVISQTLMKSNLLTILKYTSTFQTHQFIAFISRI